MVALNLVKEANKRRQVPDQVSELTTNRLSVYLRCLNTLDETGVQTISSKALAERFHLNAAQIRKDLAYFGEFGVRGVGYYVKELRRTCARSSDSTVSCASRSWEPATSAWRSPTIPAFAGGLRDRGALRRRRRKIGHESRSGVPITTSRSCGASRARIGSTSP
jgi:redox-sensing transcriptional repressor